MNSKLLVDAFVRQTMVLIAQVATTAGVRTPLAHVANQVFRDLTAALEQQGLGRKVVADMFGLALRSYQQKVDRLTESASSGGLAGGSVETLFETQRAWTMALDAHYVYWIANASFDDTTVALWRARRDGEGEVAQLAEGWTFGGGFRGVAVADDWIYFKADCDSGGHVLRVPKPAP